MAYLAVGRGARAQIKRKGLEIAGRFAIIRIGFKGKAMPRFEYRVVPAPKSGLKAKGVRSNEDRFAHALESLMNELGAQGWDYVRADTLPAEERQGLTGRTTVYQNMLVFRRETELAQAVSTQRMPELAVVAPPALAAPVRFIDPDATVIPVPPPGPRLVAD